MGFPPIDKSFEGTFKEVAARLILVERRLAIGGVGGSSAPYDANPGMIMPYAGAAAPDGWLFCDGSAVSRTTYAKLYSAIGTAYGAGDGSTTFNLPNLKGRVPVGRDAAQTEFDVMGEAGGAKAVTLTIAEMPSHSHQWNAAGTNNPGGVPANWDDIVGANTSALGVGPSNPEQGNAISPRGGGGAHNNLQPYVVTNYIISTGDGTGGGGVKSTGGGGSYQAAAGLVSPYAGTDTAVPSGWLLCDGRLVARAAYPALFAAIGTTYGAGDGSTTFGLPNYKGRVLVGRDAAQGEFDVLGETGGEKAHTLTIAEMPAHQHSQTFATNAVAAGGGAAVGGMTSSGGVGVTPAQQVVSSTGGGGAHNNLQPYAVANYIISTGSGVGGGGSSVPPLPDPVTAYTTAAFEHLDLNAGAGVWVDAPGCSVTYTLAHPMWVQVEFSGVLGTPAINTYAMIGVGASGALTLNPERDQKTNVDPRFGLTPYSLSTQNNTQSGTKLFLLPAGTTTLQFQARRSATTVIPVVDYPTLHAIPLSWVGAPGAIADVAIAGRATIAADGTTPATAGTTFTVNWSAYDGLPGVWSAAAPSRFVLNKPGKWRVTGKIRMTGATNGIAYMNIWKNGITITQNEDLRTIGPGGGYPQTMDIISSNGSDYIEFRATNSNASQAINAQNCLVTLEWIGA